MNYKVVFFVVLCGVNNVYTVTVESLRTASAQMIEKIVSKSKSGASSAQTALANYVLEKSIQAQLESASYKAGMLSLAALSYGAGIWWLKETIRDMPFRYLELKKEYEQTICELQQEGRERKISLTPRELHIAGIVQACYRIPGVYWREIISICITYGLFRTGYYLHKQA